MVVLTPVLGPPEEKKEDKVYLYTHLKQQPIWWVTCSTSVSRLYNCVFIVETIIVETIITNDKASEQKDISELKCEIEYLSPLSGIHCGFGTQRSLTLSTVREGRGLQPPGKADTCLVPVHDRVLRLWLEIH